MVASMFAPVARYSSIRVVLAVANTLDLELHQMDVKTAFSNSTLEEDISMAQPAVYVKEKVCNLRKSLYGLNQSVRCWNMEINRFLKDSEYKQRNADSCIYTKVVSSNGNQVSFVILSLYVDYILITSNDSQLLVKEKH